ncbi:hypothetical protein D9M72_581000 [compost metagenome]
MRPDIHGNELRAAGKNQRTHQRHLRPRKPLAGGNRAEHQPDRHDRHDERCHRHGSGPKVCKESRITQCPCLPVDNDRNTPNRRLAGRIERK